MSSPEIDTRANTQTRSNSGSRREASLGFIVSLAAALFPGSARAQGESLPPASAPATVPAPAPSRTAAAGQALSGLGGVRPTNVPFTSVPIATFEAFTSERRFIVVTGRNELESKLPTESSSKSAKLERDVYFVLPAPSLIRSAVDVAGYPPIVHDLQITDTGMRQLTLAFTLCTDGVMELALEAVIKRRAELGLTGAFDLYPWPFSEILCQCRVRDGVPSDDDILAVSFYGPIESEGTSTLMLPFDFTGDSDSRFHEAFKKGRLEFRFAATFSGQQFNRVTYRIVGAAAAVTEVLTALQSASGGENYITQRDRDGLVRSIQERIHLEGTIEGGGKASSLAPALLTSISFEALMRSLDKVELSGDDLKSYLDKGDHKRQLASWCGALVNQYLASQAKTQTSASGSQHEHGTTTGTTNEESGSVGGGVSFLCFDFGGEKTSTTITSQSEFDKVVNFVQQQTGMQFTRSSATNTYALSSISVFAQSKSASKREADVGGVVSSYEPVTGVTIALTPVSAEFSEAVLEANLKAPLQVKELLEELTLLKGRLTRIVTAAQRAGLAETLFEPELLREGFNPERDSRDLRRVAARLNCRLTSVLPLHSARYLESVRAKAEADLKRLAEETRNRTTNGQR